MSCQQWQKRGCGIRPFRSFHSVVTVFSKWLISDVQHLCVDSWIVDIFTNFVLIIVSVGNECIQVKAVIDDLHKYLPRLICLSVYPPIHLSDNLTKCCVCYQSSDKWIEGFNERSAVCKRQRTAAYVNSQGSRFQLVSWLTDSSKPNVYRVRQNKIIHYEIFDILEMDVANFVKLYKT